MWTRKTEKEKEDSKVDKDKESWDEKTDDIFKCAYQECTGLSNLKKMKQKMHKLRGKSIIELRF